MAKENRKQTVMAKRTYQKDGVTVLWDSDLCTHCENCWRQLPSVFDPKARPCLPMDGASAEEITSVVRECPSGALSVGK